MWAYESVFYQIYPLGACGAPFENDGKPEKRLKKLDTYVPHLKKLGVKGVLFNPLFDSDTHGYNTRDYRKVDVRLGDNADFKKLVDKLHKAGIKVILDAVFNHVGRGFWGFTDVLEKREGSEYKDWFHINFGGNNGYNDGLWYEGWEGNFDLVKLNLQNPAVTDYLIDTVRYWIDTFDIDGLRLDVAYCLDQNFIRRLRYESSQMKEDFFLMGEMIGGDYRNICGEGLCDSATNYECYKGLFSSMNSYNLFEITHSLLRQFGPENWTLYRGMHLWSFVDNHDVTRVSSILANPEHIKPIYALMFGMPGIPSIYYGSEWGFKADKSQGDPALRPMFDKPLWNELTDYIKGCVSAFQSSKALQYGAFKSLVLQNKACVWERETDDDRVLVACNIDGAPFTAHFDARAGQAVDLITSEMIDFGGGLEIPPYTAYILKPQ
ncbi:alpha-amylase family glycosyl hydrolase [Butyrivibrio sp. TB]|uniref:alpha-amylase family glycosyl hydrolase n=1 Tax=Butyrivibrio sp. TB TaxID=1520809 RepID=UPI0008CB9454|nr:alpha-amylase family glycosyl hydrolase [Butyrivibrio sp. TB]SEP55326.1 Glycosidase [Butyrivibrio sp. TB]